MTNKPEVDAPTLNTIYCGSEIFKEILRDAKQADSSKRAFLFGVVNFIKSERMTPTSLFTSDPSLAKALKEMEKEKCQ